MLLFSNERGQHCTLLSRASVQVAAIGTAGEQKRASSVGPELTAKTLAGFHNAI